MVKNLPVNEGNAGDAGLIPGSGTSPGGGNGNPLQYSYLEMPRTEEPGGRQFIGLQRVGHDWSDLVRTHGEYMTTVSTEMQNPGDQSYPQRVNTQNSVLKENVSLHSL